MIEMNVSNTQWSGTNHKNKEAHAKI